MNLQLLYWYVTLYSQTTVTQRKHKKWLLSGGEYQYKLNIWEHFIWLIKTGWLLKRGYR